jgi:hypothetical protein
MLTGMRVKEMREYLNLGFLASLNVGGEVAVQSFLTEMEPVLHTAVALVQVGVGLATITYIIFKIRKARTGGKVEE